MFSVHTTPEEFKPQQSQVILDFFLRKELSQGNCMIIVTIVVLEKFRFQMSSVHTKSRCFQIYPVGGAFSKSSVFVTD